MPFPAWHRKRPSGVECCLSSVVVLHSVVMALVTAVPVLNAVKNLKQCTGQLREMGGEGGGERSNIHRLSCCAVDCRGEGW